MRAVCTKSLVHLVTAAIVLLFAPPGVNAQELPFTHYTTESIRNPLPSAVVTGIHQDALGYVWLSVFSTGLVRYDGGVMELFTEDDGLRDLGVYRLVEDTAGRLWVASRGGVVASDLPLGAYGIDERIRFVDQIGGAALPSSSINTNAIAADARGSVWIGASDVGLFRFRSDRDGTALDTVLTTEGAPLEAITAVVARADGSVWVGRYDGSLYAVDSVAVVAQRLPFDAGDSGHVTALFEAGDGQLWAGTVGGMVIRVTGDKSAPMATPVGEALGAMVTSLTEGADGSIWVGTEGSGVRRIRPSTGETISLSERNGLLGRTVHEIMRDAEGNLWFAQLGGVSKLRLNFDAYRNYSAHSHRGEQPVLPAPAVGAIAVTDRPDAPCRIWIGTSEGGIACLKEDGSAETVQSSHGLRSDWVNALALDQEGRLWIGTQSGIQVLSFERRPPEGGAAKRIAIGGRSAYLTGLGPDQIAVFTISNILMPAAANDAEGVESLWFGGWDLFCRVDDQWFVFGSPAGLPSTRVHAAAYDDHGRLWVSTQGEGIYRTRMPLTLEWLKRSALSRVDLPGPDGGRMSASVLRDAVFERVSATDSTALDREVYRLVWAGGRLWAATADGVVAIRPQAGSRTVSVEAVLDQDAGLGADLAMSLAYAPESNTIWAGTNGGLSEIDVARGVVVRTLTTQDGLIGNEGWYTGSVAVSRDGTVFYGSARGLSSYRPTGDAPNRVPPRIRLRTVRLTQEGGLNEFAAEYAALGYTEESRTRFRTRLLGYDARWTPAQPDDRIRYTNLPAVFVPKTYTLEILASNSSGVWSADPLRYQFRVLPPPWLRWWAMGLYALILLAGGVTVHRVQHGRLLRKERARAQIREAELRAEAAHARSEMAEAASRALEEENRLKEAELEKARELERAYHALKVTQAQLIQSEKLASLGQLTAGIAHEIKNPLNFVTNFATLTRELASELSERAENEAELRLSDVRDDLGIIQMNTAKIEEHGHRADGIVRSMLEHSRGGAGEREETNVNALLEQYVNLAYHGERARRTGFNVTIDRQYEPHLESIQIVQQDLGRVLLNLLDNAFHAVHEKAQSSNGTYTPTVSVSTRRADEAVEIGISDNGGGIPQDIRRHIFEPFFTTKPTGQGTGLGLSLSHNIVVQGFGGEFLVDSTEGEGTTFLIRLPLSNHS